jgi:translocation and assembly module TamA
MNWRVAAALAAAWLSGCAALTGAPLPTEEAGAAQAAMAATSTTLEVEAPAELKALLERHLDLARVGRMAGDEAIDDSEWTRLIDAAPAQARELLQTEGYFEPTMQLTRDSHQRRVKLALDPGHRASIAKVTLEVEGQLDQASEGGDEYARNVLAEWRRSWKLPVGTPFRNPAWSGAKAAALARLRAAGYANANWSGTAAEVDATTQEVRLFLVADSGPLYRFGSLQIEGLVAHEAETVGHLAAVPVGTPVSETLLLDYQERLQKSGLFDSATVTLDPDPEKAGAARVIVRLKEAPMQVWTFGVGVSANTGPRASVEHVYRRVFGQPLTAHNKVIWGGQEQSWTGELSTHPGEGQYRELLGGTVDRLKSSSDIVVSQQIRLGRTQDTQRIERLYYVQGERSARKTLGDQTLTNTIALSVNYAGVWRQLDSVILPTEGFSISAQGGLGHSHGTDATTGLYTRLYGRLTGYLPVGNSWYGQARIEFGQVVKRATVAVPESQLFRAGGDDSVRGYGYRDLGPVVDGSVSGGTALFTTSVEMARPISASLPSLWGAVFVDAGNAVNGLRDFKAAVGTGVGLRWRSPVGPLRLDLAYGREVHKFRLHFSVGIAF